VLFLSGLQIHPTRSGGNLRSFALANALQRHGLEVFVYSMVGRKKDYLRRCPSSIQAWPEGIQEYVDRRVLGFVAQYGSYGIGLPPVWLTAYLERAAVSPGKVLLPALLREKLAWCDVVVADAPFVHPIFSAASPGRLRVLSTHNVEHRMYDEHGGPRNRRLRAVVRDIELEAAGACDILASCCDEDRRFFEANARVRQSVLVPNGIDLRRFRGIEGQRFAMRRALGIADDVKCFLFTASKYGPNREAFDYLLAFARNNPQLLAEKGIHILVAGNVVKEPVRVPGFTATGRVDSVEPYFAAADAALNPMSSGGGTNVKMCEFIAMHLPIVSTPFGARGFLIEGGRTGFLFEKERLAEVLSAVRRLFDDDPVRLRRMAEEAYARNEDAIDMDSCVRPLVEAIAAAPERSAHLEPAPLLRTHARSE
jgi:glycosyltransferase involved in cell wall biosynthesis